MNPELLQIILVTASLGSSLAALATAIATAKMVGEMKQQRKISFYPRFAPQPLTFKAIYTSTGRYIFTDESSYAHEGSDVTFDRNLAIRIVNVGGGAATRIQGNWTFEIEAFLHQLYKFCGTEMITFVNRNKWLEIKIENFQSAHNLEPQMRFELPYSLPATQSAEGKTIEVPMVYISLLELWLHFTSKQFNDKNLNIQSPPGLVLSLLSTSIDGNEITQKFSFEINFSSFFPEPEANYPFASGRFKIHEVNT